MTAVATKLITIEEISKMPDPEDGSQQDLVRGEIVVMPPPQGVHGFLVMQIGFILKSFVDPRKLGWVCGGDVGAILERAPDTLRGIDVAFWSINRQRTRPKTYMIPPDLAIEVLSPNCRRKLVLDKVRDYVKAGVKLVWFVDPKARTVTVYKGTMRGIVLAENDTIDGGEVLRGFTCNVSEIV